MTLRDGQLTPAVPITGDIARSDGPGIASSLRDVVAMIQHMKGEIVGADVVEFNPKMDLGGVTAAVTAKIVKEIAGRMIGAR